MMNKPMIIAGNWKLNKTPYETKSFLTEMLGRVAKENQAQYVVFPSSICLDKTSEVLKDSSIGWGAQNCYSEREGAYTGEISILSLKELGATHCLVGHSERRQLFHEDNELLSKKIQLIQSEKILPILCIGETLAQRESSETYKLIENQLKEGLSKRLRSVNFWIAYEPVWAIGTGKVATPEQVSEVHDFIRTWLENNINDLNALEIPILYGGSVKPENSKELSKISNVNGFLVGGASLKLDSFLEI